MPAPLKDRWPALLLIVSLAFGAGSETRARESLDPESAEAAILALTNISPWQTSVDLLTRAGYKDNVLFSAFVPEGSGFIGAGVEALAARPLGDRASFQSLGSLDYRYYPGVDSVPSETVALVSVEAGIDPWAEWTFSAAADYLFQDQVVDVSATEADLRVVKLLGHLVTGRAGARRRLGASHWLRLEGAGHRDLYAAPLDDLWEVGGLAEWGWRPSKRAELNLEYAYSQRRYDTDPALADDGLPLEGTLRRENRHQLRAVWRQEWDAAARWRTTVRVGGLMNQDPAMGYYDYSRVGGAVLLRYRRDLWRLELGPRLQYYHYGVQTVSELDLDARRRTELWVDARLEWTPRRWLGVFAEYSNEQTFSPRPDEEYAVRVAAAGVRVTF